VLAIGGQVRGADNFDALKAEFMRNAELEKEFSEEIVEETKKFSKETIVKDKSREDFLG